MVFLVNMLICVVCFTLGVFILPMATDKLLRYKYSSMDKCWYLRLENAQNEVKGGKESVWLDSQVRACKCGRLNKTRVQALYECGAISAIDDLSGLQSKRQEALNYSFSPNLLQRVCCGLSCATLGVITMFLLGGAQGLFGEGGALLMDLNATGANAVGVDVASVDAVSIDATGANAVGVDVAGADVAGTDVLGANSLGADTLGATIFNSAPFSSTLVVSLMCVIGILLTCVCVCDLRARIIPYQLCALYAIVSIVWVLVVRSVSDVPICLYLALASALCVCLIERCAVRITGASAIGAGDRRLIPIIAFQVGLNGLFAGLLAMSATGLVMAVFSLVRGGTRKSYLPFAPPLYAWVIAGSVMNVLAL